MRVFAVDSREAGDGAGILDVARLSHEIPQEVPHVHVGDLVLPEEFEVRVVAGVVAPVRRLRRVATREELLLRADLIGAVVEGRALEQRRHAVLLAGKVGDHGLGRLKVRLESEAENALVGFADGDARTALTALEVAASATQPDEKGDRVVTLQTVEDALQHRAL
ncbi:MAG: hypothetical protein ACE10K_06665, partial [Rhodothermales bacterium]